MHHIAKTTLSLLIGGAPSEAFDMQQQAMRLWEQEVLPALDAAFSGMAGKDELLRLDRVEVDVQGLRANNWKEELARRITQAVVEAIEKQLSGSVPGAQARRVPVATGHFETWLYFLEHGYLPMSVKTLALETLQQASLVSVAAQMPAKQALLRLLRRQEGALQRLLWQHSEAFLQSLAEAISGRSLQTAMDFRQEMKLLLARPLENYAPVGKPQKSGKAVEKTPLLGTKTLKTDWADFQKKWPETFWASLWKSFVLTEKPFEAAVFLQENFSRWFKADNLSTLIGLLEHHVGGEPEKFPQLKPGLVLLGQQTAAVSRELPTPSNMLSPEPSITIQDHNQLNPVSPESEKVDLNAEKSTTQNIREKEKSKAQENNSEQAMAQEIKQKKESGKMPDALKTPQTDAVQFNQSKMPQKAADALDEHSSSRKKAADTTPDPVKRSEDAHWYVANAGVVLLHPFLSGFFDTLGLLKDRAFKNEAKRHRAVYLVHYLATGEFEAPEYDLVFAKHLCGMAPETPLNNSGPVKKSQQAQVKREATDLLQAVLSHWKKLGSTSPDGLRNGFLRRAGKLSYTKMDGWKLQVEQSSIDILLNSLPWGYGMVKLPWMQEMLVVDWT